MKEIEARMQKGFNMEMSSHPSRGEQARAMIMAQNSVASASDNAFGEEAFSEVGRAAMHSPNVKELLPPEEDNDPEKRDVKAKGADSPSKLAAEGEQPKVKK